MNDRDGTISRRDALGMALGVGAGLALRPRDLRAHEAVWEELEPASLVTKPIPSTGERLPVVGIGTARGPMTDAAVRRRMAALVEAS